MNESRWHMNRIGFVNFWLYDEEYFDFENGKLLLRGQNGSGKSITTQSFIPFILDGDRTPSRLDPFGSNDRRMEYYLLGEGDRDESTGYLFLEFKKKDTEQYRTIGIGQRAQKGKSMGFWGFIILDGRRIGTDINLYKKAGNKKIPCTKQEMKNIIGINSRFFETQKEYMENVNKYIFGFPKAEQYDQFIKLLVKVRAPKLSNEFKPAKVYEILNSSLRTLSDDDLKAMVDTMEKMDDIQIKLDNTKISFKDLDNIQKEYNKYNKYFISEKARAYIEEKKKADHLKSEFEKKKDDLNYNEEKICTLKNENIVLDNEIEILSSEKNSLDITDIENRIEKLNFFKDERNKAEEEKQIISKKIDERQKKIIHYDSEIRNCKIEIDSYDQESVTILQSIDIYNKSVEFEFNNKIKNLANSHNITEDYRELERNLNELQNAVEKGKSAIFILNDVTKKWDFASKELEDLRILKKTAQEELHYAEDMDSKCRDEIIELYYKKAGEYKELFIENEILNKTSILIRKYQGNKDFGEISSIFRIIYEEKRYTLVDDKSLKINEKNYINTESEKLKEELIRLMDMEFPEPERKNKVLEARKLLKENNIKFVPFYEAFEFAENISQEKQDLLESQFIAAGLIDALIVAEKDYEFALNGLKGFSDVLINVNDNNYNYTFDDLIVGDIDVSLKKSAENVLKNISQNPASDALFVISEDGYFRNGIIEGYSFAEEHASYIGPKARKYRKEKLISEKQNEIDILNEKLNLIESDMNEIDKRINILEKEYSDLPNFINLDEAIDMLKNAEKEYEKCNKDYEEKENEVYKLEDQKKQHMRNVIEICRNLPYIREISVFEQVIRDISDYKECLSNLYDCVFKRMITSEKLEDIKIKLENEEFEKDDDFRSMQKEEKNIKNFDIEIKNIEEYLDNNEFREKSRRLNELNNLIKSKSQKITNNDKNIAVCDNDVKRLEKEIEEDEINVNTLFKREQKLKKYFEEELSLELILKKSEKSLYESALEASEILNESERNKSISDVTGNLIKIYQKYSGSLARYGISLEYCFDDDTDEINILRKRYRVVCLWQGKKYFIHEFYNILKGVIESTEIIIQESDRKLFEDILADTLSRKLNNRIVESRKWIKEMSELMGKIDTSMGLIFSMDWKAKSAEGENGFEVSELEKILRKDKELLTKDDIEKVSLYFRNRINIEKQISEEKGEVVNYSDLIRKALDYRDWFEFKIYYCRSGETKKELTNSAFNKFSGGEKAMAIYVPLFAAVNAQYKKTENPDHPRIIALDEAFAGVDDINISSMFELVEKLDFDYIMNSQVLWGCFKTVKSLKIVELQRANNSSVVTAINFCWNGCERICEL